MRTTWVKSAMVILLLVALVTRLYQIDSLSNQFHVDRQYYAGQIVRGVLWGHSSTVPEWRRRISLINQPPLLEPPIVQFVALIGYELTGGEHLWIPRTFSAIMWVMGGWFLFLTARKLVREEAALIAAAFYLFAPFGIEASRSFQPNPMMIAWIVISWYAILLYFEQPSTGRLALAAAAAGIANLALIYAVFIIFPLFGWLALQKYGLRRTVLNRHSWLFAFFSLLPCGIYYILGYFIYGFLRSQTSSLFNAGLWITTEYWIDWLGRIIIVGGLIPLILSIQALITVRKPLQAATLRSLWLGYFLFGFAFNWPISSHDYYSLPVIPIAALSLGYVANFVLSALRSPKMRRWIPVAAVIIVGIIVVDGLVRYLPTTVTTPEEIKEVETAEKIGSILKHSPDVIFLTPDFGSVLFYYGEISGTAWPNRWGIYAEFALGRPQIDAQQRMQSFLKAHKYHFFVVTALDDLTRQPDLEQQLKLDYRLLVRTNDYAIYSLSKF